MRELGVYQRLIDVSFSPDNSKLYFSCSGYNQPNTPDGLYPNMVVPYLAKQDGLTVVKGRVFYLNKPNLPGWQCERSYRDFIHIESTVGIAFPNFMQHYFNNLEPVDNFFDEEECKKIKVYPNPTEDLARIGAGDIKCLLSFTVQVYNTIGQLLIPSR